jgi:hypothetical protein
MTAECVRCGKRYNPRELYDPYNPDSGDMGYCPECEAKIEQEVWTQIWEDAICPKCGKTRRIIKAFGGETFFCDVCDKEGI